ncbi:ABC transporter substrate-binding protein [Desulfobacula sp.]|uniref:ABC transporter substrate-binding protein n=1 Tax=Desulfobacula sp. TaxID=2593537 RepID=UPI0025B84F47|nr:ABC transporter substrate-binding protein [Desulfobacula sp.]
MKQKTNVFMIVFWLVLLISNPVVFGQETGKKNVNLRIVTDLAGRQVKIAGPVNKIVTTFKPATLCVLSLGLEKKLVGIDTSSGRDRLGMAVFPGIKKVKGIGSKSMGINFETLVSLEPDLVILYSQKDGRKLANRLKILNIPSIVILPETFDTIKHSLELIARAVGGTDQTISVGRHMDEIISLVQDRLSDLPDKERKTGYFASPRGLFSTATGNMLQHEIFTTAGIYNVSCDLKGYFQDISPEQLIKWNPDIMVLSRHMKKGAAKQLSNKGLSRLTAVSHHKVYRCPSDLAPWDFPSPLSVLASLWLAKKVYPDRFLDIDLKDKVNGYYKALFNKTMDQMGGNLDDKIWMIKSDDKI